MVHSLDSQGIGRLDTMKELKYIEKIRSGGTLLSMPQSLAQVLSMINKDGFGMQDLGRVIMNDPGLTSKVLKMANSAFYRRQAQIATVNQAVIVLGVTQVKCLALSASVFQPDLVKAEFGIDSREMFSHFISVGLGSRMLAEAMGLASGEEAFVGGLLHDIGLVFLIHHFPDDYRAVVKSIGKYHDTIEAEKAVLGINHAEIGRMLAEKWNFPPNLCDAIGYHHLVPDRIDKVELMHLVQLARLINKPLLEERPGNLERRLAALSRLAEMMHIDRNVIDDISYALLTETMTASEYLGIDIGNPAEVLARANRELFKSYLTIESLFRERQELSQRILKEERRAAMMETKTVAIATMSHYINNAAMAISGRGQLIRMLRDRGSIIDQENRLAPITDVIEKSVKKILAVLEELRDLTDLEEMQKYTDSQAINIDDRLKERLSRTEEEPQDVIMERPALK